MSPKSLSLAGGLCRQEIENYTYDLELLAQDVALAELKVKQLKEAGVEAQLGLNVELAQLEIDILERGVDPAYVADVKRAALNVHQLEATIADAQIIAPFDGNMLTKRLTEGKEVLAFKEVLIIADLNNLEVRADGQDIQRGHLIGGCFEVLDWLRGTDFWPEVDVWQDAILFLETSEDAPSPEIVKYGLRTYAASGILERLSGILFARPGGQIPPEKFQEYDRILQQVVAKEAGLTDLPIITNMDFGHTDPMFVLPYGVQAEIDCNKQTFSIVESAVVDS